MKVTEAFISETTVKALIAFIPSVGGAIGSILADVLAERKQQRLDDFLTRLKEDFEKQKDEIKKDLVRKADFLDIFELTAKKVMEERNEVKRHAYKNILVNGITQDYTSFDDMEQCVRLVENTTENNIYLLKVLSDPEGYNISVGKPVKKPKGNMSTITLSRLLQELLPEWQGGQILENLKDLEFIGLVEPISSNFQVMITENGLSPVKNQLTLKGKRFVRYIKS